MSTVSYAPTEIKVVSLGVGISDDTLSKLNIISDQCLIAGERVQSISGAPDALTYGLIVDTQGIAINTTTTNRGSSSNNYAAYIDGDVRVTGNIFADGSLFGSAGTGAGTGAGTDTSGNVIIGDGQYWVLANDGTYNNLYYNENITIGNLAAASNNLYKVNIVTSSDTNIEQVQLSLQNLNSTQLRIGVVGGASNSPVIFNTNNLGDGGQWDPAAIGGAIEFHVGRDQDYFSNVYGLGTVISGEDAQPYGSVSGVPDYSGGVAPPHMMLDYAGNVGINTSINSNVTYNQRLFQPLSGTIGSGTVRFTSNTTVPNLNVNGATYSKDLLIYDYESAAVCNVDDLYVRKLGVTLAANQVQPGAFANGDYTFPNGLEIGQNATIDNDLLVNGTTRLDIMTANTAVIDSASFCNDALFNRDLLVNQAIRIRGQIYTEVLDYVESDGTSNYGFQMIQFTPASPTLSNINVMGSGISTPGRLGVGVNPRSNNPVNNQTTIYKTNPNIWELELIDKSDPAYNKKAGFIGHPSCAGSLRSGYDGSLVIATPSATQRDYSGSFRVFPQHIYFFPGADFSSTTQAFLQERNPPTLGIFKVPPSITNPRYLNAVGINTYYPISELDVRGTITFTGGMQYMPNGPNSTIIQVGIWEQQKYTDPRPNAPSLYYSGLSYMSKDSNAAHVGINTIPSAAYGLIIGGACKLNNGLYTADSGNVDRLAGLWMDNRDAPTMSNNVAPQLASTAGGVFTWASAGVGVKTPTANLEVKDNYSSSNGTRIQITRGQTPLTSLVYQGGIDDDAWAFQANHVVKRFEIGRGQTPFSNDSNLRYIWMRPNPINNTPQVYIGTDAIVYNSASNPDPNASLTVGGDMVVLGDVNITGQFRINAKPLVNSNVQGATQPILNEDDVYIGGANIQFVPNAGHSVVVGTPFSGTANSADTDKMFRVYAPASGTNQGIIASFQANADTALVELMATTTRKKLIFGTLNPTGTINSRSTYGTSFAFMNENYQSYMNFGTLNSSSTSAGSVGFGIPFGQAPTATIHVYSEDTGANMLRLTKGVINRDTNRDAPQMDFQKNYQMTSGDLGVTTKDPTTWSIKGPDASFQEKLSFYYRDDSRPTPAELFTFANNGCIGIGNTQPEFAIDILNVNNIGAIRMRDTGNAVPHIVFQSGDLNYGADWVMDYRMVSCNSEFIFDSQTPDGVNIIMDISSNNKIGIGCAYNSNFDVFLNGIVNVGQSIYLQGAPLFSAGDAVSGQGTTISSTNIYLNAEIDSTYNGSVVVNGTQPTGNLFTLNSGNNANLFVLDSKSNMAQMHFRTLTPDGIYNMWRMETSNVAFQWQFYPNCYNDLTIADDDVGFSNAMFVEPTLRPGAPSSEFDLNLFGSYFATSDSNPALIFNNTQNTVLGSIGSSNNCIYVKSENADGIGVGIGTYSPQASGLHVVANDVAGMPAFHVDSTMTGSLLDVSSAGVTTTNAVNVAAGSEGMPAYSFTNSLTTGIYQPSTDDIAVCTNGIPAFYVGSTNKVFLGDIASVDFTNSVTVAAAASVNMFGNVDVQGSLLPSTTDIYDLGSATKRWRDVYLSSGGSIDIGGSKITHMSDGSLSTTQRIVTKETLLGSTSANQVLIKSATSNIAIVVNGGSGNSNTFYPLLTDPGNTTASIGYMNTTINAAFNIYASNSIVTGIAREGLTINQCSTPFNASSNNNILRLMSNYSNVLTVEQDGSVGIGLGSNVRTRAVIDINTQGKQGLGLLVHQANSSKNVAEFYSSNANAVVINSNGYVGIGCTNPQSNLHVYGNVLVDGHATFTSNVNMDANLYIYGNSYVQGNQTAGVMNTNSSDRRLKKDIVKIENALEKLMTLTGYTYSLIDDADEPARRYTGLIAQDVESVLPEAILKHGSDGMMSVAYGNMMGLVIEAMKEIVHIIKSDV